MIQPTLFATHTDFAARLGHLPVRKTITVPHIDLRDLLWVFCLNGHDPATLRTVLLYEIVPTQAKLKTRLVRAYAATHRHTNTDGWLPHGIRFQGDPAIYLLDGHHRWYAARLRGERTFLLHIEDCPYTMERALSFAAGTEQPAALNSTSITPIGVGEIHPLEAAA